MTVIHSLFCCIVFLASLFASAVQAAMPLVLTKQTQRILLAPHVEFLADATGRMTLSDVTSAPPNAYQPVVVQGGEINFGYSSAAYWLRFVLQPRADAPSDWLLEVAYPSLDSVEVYADSHKWQTGDLRPFAERPIEHRNFVFPLHLNGGEPTTVLLRVVSEGNLTVPLTVWAPGAFASASRDSYVALSIYYGMLIALVLYNLLLYLSVRDRNFLLYVLFATGMAVGQLSANGLGNEYLWPNWPAWGNAAFPVGFALTGLFGAAFSRAFLDTAKNVPRLDRVIAALAGAFALSALTTLLGYYRPGAMLTSLTGVTFSAVAVLAGLLCLRRGHAGARYFLLAWSLMLLGAGVLGARNLGWLPTNFTTVYSMQIGSALEMLLLSFALADRINALQHEKERAQSDALAAHEALVTTLRNSELELEQRVAERTYELEASNRELEMRRLQLQEIAHHDLLTGLANRLLLDIRMEHALTQCRRNRHGLAVLLLDLDGFKPINDQHGHAVGDEVLKEVARRLLQAVRAADTVARLGGDEFVILLESVNSAEDAEQVAQKVLSQLSIPCRLGDLDLTVAGSVGIALHPADGESALELLQHADQAMYRAKQGGRGNFRRYAS